MKTSSLYQNEIRLSLRLAMPLMLGLLAQTGLWIINSIMMGYLGTKALAAGALAITAYYLVFVFYFGLINAVGICVAHAKGTENEKDITLFFQQGIYLVFLISIPMTLMIMYLPYLFSMLKQPDDVVQLATEFLHGISYGCFGILGFSLFREFNSAMEKSVILMYVSILALPVIALLDYCFITGSCYFPKLGMYGIGIATSIVQWLMFFAIMLYSLSKTELNRHTHYQYQKIHWMTILHFFEFGLPMGMTFFFEAGLFSISAVMMGWTNVDALAAHQILLQCIEITFMCFFAFAQTTAVRVSKFTSMNAISKVQIPLMSNITFGFIIAVLISLAFIFFPDSIIAIYIDIDNKKNMAVIHYAKQFFIIASIFVFFDMLQVIINNALRGIKDTLIPMIIGLGSYWIVGICAAYYFGFILNLHGTGIWLGLTFGLIITNIALWLRWFYSIRKLKHSNIIHKTEREDSISFMN